VSVLHQDPIERRLLLGLQHVVLRASASWPLALADVAHQREDGLRAVVVNHGAVVFTGMRRPSSSCGLPPR